MLIPFQSDSQASSGKEKIEESFTPLGATNKPRIGHSTFGPSISGPFNFESSITISQALKYTKNDFQRIVKIFLEAKTSIN